MIRINKQFIKRLIFYHINALQFNLYLLDQYVCVGVLSDNHTQKSKVEENHTLEITTCFKKTQNTTYLYLQNILF